eukprot:6475982-Amphidinium_carterae.2
MKSRLFRRKRWYLPYTAVAVASMHAFPHLSHPCTQPIREEEHARLVGMIRHRRPRLPREAAHEDLQCLPDKRSVTTLTFLRACSCVAYHARCGLPHPLSARSS